MYTKGCTAPRAASHHSIYKVDGTIHAVEHHLRKLHLQQKLNGAQIAATPHHTCTVTKMATLLTEELAGRPNHARATFCFD